MEPAEEDKLRATLDPEDFGIVPISVVSEEDDGRSVFRLRSRIHGGELNVNGSELKYTGKLAGTL